MTEFIPLPPPEEIDAYERVMRSIGLFDCAVMLQEIAKLRRAGQVFHRGETPFRGLLPMMKEGA